MCLTLSMLLVRLRGDRCATAVRLGRTSLAGAHGSRRGPRDGTQVCLRRYVRPGLLLNGYVVSFASALCIRFRGVGASLFVQGEGRTTPVWCWYESLFLGSGGLRIRVVRPHRGGGSWVRKRWRGHLALLARRGSWLVSWSLHSPATLTLKRDNAGNLCIVLRCCCFPLQICCCMSSPESWVLPEVLSLAGRSDNTCSVRPLPKLWCALWPATTTS